MSADAQDAATKSPSKGFSLKSRFLGLASSAKPAVQAAPTASEEKTTKSDAGPGSALLAAMLGDDEPETANEAVAETVDASVAEEAPATPPDTPAEVAAEPPANGAPALAAAHTFSFRSRFLGSHATKGKAEAARADDSAPKAEAREPEPSIEAVEPPPAAKATAVPAPAKTFSFKSRFLGLSSKDKNTADEAAQTAGASDALPPEAQQAMSEIKAALVDEVRAEAKAELKTPPLKEEKPQPPSANIKEAVIVENGAEAASEPDPEPEPAGPIPFVRFAGVRKTYDGIALVVKDLNLDIEKGEFLTLLGPSGSGKTTTLLMLAGFETPTEGDILLEGKSMSALAPHQRGLGFVFQNYALFPHMSVGENLSFPLEVRRKSKTEIRQRVQRALKMVELEGFDKRKPHQLSGGQQQRVAVARALVFDPTLVLMDEPLGALDKHLREQMQYELKRIHRELGVTVVYVTHDQSEALTLSDRIAIFHDGQIQQLDTPAKIYDAPANAFVAGFIGENNSLAGRVLSVDDKLCTIELSGGTRVKAIKGNCGGAGSAAVVCVRPENLTLSEESGPHGGENQLGAMVDDMVFHGDHVRVKLSSTGGHQIDVKAQTRATSIPAKGVTVTLSWEPYACRAFAAT